MAGFLEAGLGFVVDEEVALGDAWPEHEVGHFQMFDLVFGANTKLGVIDGAIADGDHCAGAACSGATEAEGDFVVLEEAMGDLGCDVFFEIQGGGIGDLGGLIPAEKVTVPDGEFTSGSIGLSFGVDGVFAGALACFESGGIGGQWAGPEFAVLDGDMAV